MVLIRFILSIRVSFSCCVMANKQARKWTDEEIELLIDNFEDQPSLWDISTKDYHLRDVKNAALKKISDEMAIPVPDLKSKWNSLRTQELRERTKEEKSKSGMGADELYLSTWQFMDKMRFVGQCKKTAKSLSTLNLSTLEDDSMEEFNDIDESGSSSSEPPPTKKQKPAKPAKRKPSAAEDAEAKKSVLLTSCIEALKPQTTSTDTNRPSIDPYAVYVDQQLQHLTSESRLLAEKKINDILFELRLAQFRSVQNNNPGHSSQTHSQTHLVPGGYTAYLADNSHDPALYGGMQ